MNCRRFGWIVLWVGLLTTAISGRQATGYFGQHVELSTIQGGVPAPQNGNGQCAALSCNCFSACALDVNTFTCQTCVNPVGGTTTYLCCVNKNLGNQWNCQTTFNMANCGAQTSTPALPPPYAPIGLDVGPCLDANGMSICVTARGGEPACTTYLTVDPNKSQLCK
jgi:hypothetical protein